MDVVEKYIERMRKEKIHTEAIPLLDNLNNNWSRFKNAELADRHFLTEFAHEEKIPARIFEIHLGCYLLDLELRPTSTDKGPDFRIDTGHSTIWIEAITPDRKHSETSQTTDVTNQQIIIPPYDELKYCISGAINTKLRKFDDYRKPKNCAEYNYPIVDADDICVVAINISNFKDPLLASGVSNFPICAEIAYGAGPLTKEFKNSIEQSKYLKKEKTVDYHQNSRWHNIFEHDEYTSISALLCAYSDIGGLREISISHNPRASSPLPFAIFNETATQYIFAHQTIHIVPQQRHDNAT